MLQYKVQKCFKTVFRITLFQQSTVRQTTGDRENLFHTLANVFGSSGHSGYEIQRSDRPAGKRSIGNSRIMANHTTT